MRKWQLIIKDNKVYLLILSLVILLALIIRFNNLFVYQTYWSDDGGGHLIYVEKILQEQRLPTKEETYLAWHEPLFYLVMAGWVKLGGLFSLIGLDYWELFNLLLSVLFLGAVGLLTYYYCQKNKWLALLNVFLVSVIFISLKLSASVNNELMTHLAIISLLFLFIYWGLFTEQKIKLVISWTILLGLATQIKITVFILVLAVLLLWLIKFIISRQKVFLYYFLICLGIVILINIPWQVYKQQNYQQFFSINLYETTSKQNILTSSGWQYFFQLNLHPIIDYPFWYSLPQSYYAIFISDIFSDYYNLFDNFLKMDGIPLAQRVFVGNGRFTTLTKFQASIWVNRLGLLIFISWIIGFIGYLINIIKEKKLDYYQLLLILTLLGGWLALLYNNLRLPYLERGVLKAHFIYFTIPLLTIFAYQWWWQLFKNKIFFILITVLPIILYIILAWPIIFVR